MVASQDVVGALSVVRVGDTGHDDGAALLKRIIIHPLAQLRFGEGFAGAFPQLCERVLLALLLLDFAQGVRAGEQLDVREAGLTEGVSGLRGLCALVDDGDDVIVG